MPSATLTSVSWLFLALACITALAIAFDIIGRGYRQPMWVMEIVWPVTALYFGPMAWPAYRRWGRPTSGKMQHQTVGRRHHGFRASVAVSVSHCGAGCTIGDIIGAWIVFAVALKLLGLALPAEYLVDFALAFVLGIAFQYFAIAPMRGLGLRDGIVEALKADALSLAAFEVGLFAWMAFMQLVLFTSPHLSPAHAAYWFLMQIGMIIGFATAIPANVWLIRRGLKEAM
jgi:hypothetical protein